MNRPVASLVATSLLGLWSGASVLAGGDVAPGATPATAKPATPVAAPTPPAAALDERSELAKNIGAKPEELRPSVIKGLYEFVRGPNIAYVTADGRYYIFGDLYERQSQVNITDARRGEIQLKAINDAVPESEMVIFGPANARHTITVFTDIDCGFCRQLHKDVPELNRQGIRVRYLFFPRTGPGTPSWKKAEAVWCSSNRNEALTHAKLGEDVKAKACGATPIKRQYELAHELGINGTPGIFTDKGISLPGYRPPAQLVKELDGKF